MGFEEPGTRRADGSSGYKGKAEGSNSSEGLWIASPAGTPLSEAKHVYWFESAYDAMAYYQLFHTQNKELRKAVFVSTGGNPTAEQMRGVLAATLSARQHICFDTDLAGMDFTRKPDTRNVPAQYAPRLKRHPNESPTSTPSSDREDLDGGNLRLLPEDLQASYERFEAAHEKALSMRAKRPIPFGGDTEPDECRTRALRRISGGTAGTPRTGQGERYLVCTRTARLSPQRLERTASGGDRRQKTIHEEAAKEEEPEEERQACRRR